LQITAQSTKCVERVREPSVVSSYLRDRDLRSGRGSYLDRFYWALDLTCHTLDAVFFPNGIRLPFRRMMAWTVGHLEYIYRAHAYANFVVIAYVMVDCNHCSMNSELGGRADFAPHSVTVVVSGSFQFPLEFRIYWHSLRSSLFERSRIIELFRLGQGSEKDRQGLLHLLRRAFVPTDL
jgi:hypothetical protein